MRKSIKVVAAAVVISLLLALPASAAENTPIPHRVGARFIARAHIGHIGYNGRVHIVSGTVGLTNKALRPRFVRCLVIATFLSKHTNARIQARDLFRVNVGPQTIRHPKWHATARDPHHRFHNRPFRALAHCRVVG